MPCEIAIETATIIATLVDDDHFLLENAAGDSLVRLRWSDLLAAIQAGITVTAAASSLIAEVVIGTPEAIAARLYAGAYSFQDPRMVNRNMQLQRGEKIIPGIDPLNGNDYYTKNFTSDTSNFFSPLANGEYVKINLI